MKKIILTLFCIAQLSTIIAQEYVSFPLTNAVWVGRDFFVSNATPQYNYWHFIVKGQDTLINGIAYKKIDKKGIRNNISAIREKDKIIYLREDDKDTILYDFNIRVGDTLNGRIYGYSLNSHKVIVTSIDSILIDNKYRKKYTLRIPSSGDFGVIIEGIGCRCGFIPYFIGLDKGGSLDCHSVNDKAIFGGNNGKCDLVSNKEVIRNLTQVQIFPNPVVDKSFLKMPDDLSIDRATVYDVLGRMVKSYDVTNSPPEILKKDYSKGVYFVHVFRREQLIAFSKFIVD